MACTMGSSLSLSGRVLRARDTVTEDLENFRGTHEMGTAEAGRKQRPGAALCGNVTALPMTGQVGVGSIAWPVPTTLTF